MLKAPHFWSRDAGDGGVIARLLAPASSLYASVVEVKQRKASPWRASVPVVCVGNITLGGTGKTPFTDYISALLKEMGFTPHVLLRGYGGKQEGPLRVESHHTPLDVGDEACLHAQAWPTWVARNRADGARAAIAAGADVIVLDDGFQNLQLAHDVSFLLLDRNQGLGNGRVFPAGPLRERADGAIARATAIVLMGGSDQHGNSLPGFGDKPVITATLETDLRAIPQGRPVVAFAGIGRPVKFFDAIEMGGHALLERHVFADHHRYTQQEVDTLVRRAKALDALLVTTEKDRVRLGGNLPADLLALPVGVVVGGETGDASPQQVLERSFLQRSDTPHHPTCAVEEA